MKLIKKRLNIIIPACAVIIGILFCFVLYMPLVKKIKTLGQEVKTLEAELSDARLCALNIKETKRNISLISQEESSLAVENLSNLVKLYNINIVSISPKEIEPREKYAVLPLQITLESKYAEFGMFLGALGELEKGVFIVDGFELVPSEEEPLKLKVNLALNLLIRG